MVQRYNKGARSERELLAFLRERKFSVMRSAGSGVNSVSPDLVAFKEGKGLAFECKAWNDTSISIPAEKVARLQEWETNTGMETFIAWRMNGEGWLFIKLSELSKAQSNYTITRKRAFAINRKLADLLDALKATDS
ncbi:MAG: Holliday junction resolvase Hjc [Candidatus Micrarchaeaceae archaeon]